MVKDWLEVITRKPKRTIVDKIHDTISLFEPLNAVIDTRQFQRLRELTQTGAAKCVFPCADHRRFEHSLGVYHLSLRWVLELRKSESPSEIESKITGADVLCVALAGLIHDLGSLDLHEKGSEMMFEYLLAEYPQVKEKLMQYMTEEDLKFVYEIIDPPKPLVCVDEMSMTFCFQIQNDKWMPKYRPKEKAFLFDIVSNPCCGLDVDKLDYFLRDSKAANVGISFEKTALDRICNNMRVCYSEARKHKGIAFDEKVSDSIEMRVYIELESTFTCRIELHAKIYQHKTTLAFQHLLVEVLRAADPYIKFYAKNGKCYRMSTAFKDMSAFCQLDDRIERSGLPEMKEAQRLYKNWLERKQPRLIGKWKFRTEENYKKEAAKVSEFLVEKGICQNDIIFQQTSLHRGLGLTMHPLHKVDLYNSKRQNPVTKQMPDVKSSAGYSEIYVYLTNPKDFEDESYNFLGDSLDKFIATEVSN
ncbi:HD domain-containing protein [Aphelenchoides besseyi]|nr:HD domain-containing protein [Aphelenchoides besseyi]